jgi:cyclopropane-fatty-acyl-phospholipid synthase
MVMGRASLYDVEIKHLRTDPIRHGFSYSAQAWVIDLDSVPTLPRGLRRLAGFRSEDHVGASGSSIRANIEAVLTEHGVDTNGGRIVTMASPRVLGYTFNPLSLHWCHSTDGNLAAVVAEVHNTYGERHCYVIHPDDAGRADVEKAFYVSPFYPVDGTYRMSVPEPDDRLAVTLTLHREGERPFVASIRGERRSSEVTLWRALLTPLATRAVMFRIKRHGITLWLKGLRPSPRPIHPSGPSGRVMLQVTAPNPALDVNSRLDVIDAMRWPDIAAQPHRPIRAAVARRLMQRAVAHLPIRLVLPDGRVLGQGDATSPAMRLVRPEAFYDRLGATGLIGFGEAFMAGDWVAGDGTPPTARRSLLATVGEDDAASSEPVDDLAEVLAVFAERMGSLIPPWLQRLRQAALLRAPSAQDNTVHGSRNNISHHYDLSNDLFKVFLDPSLSYSSALFEGDPAFSTESLRAAQHRKINRLLDVAAVGEGSRVLEIGTGWGELAILAAERGAQVTTITLSKEQAELAEKRIAEAGQSEHIEVRLQDYREVTGTFDAIVSVEMIEAVGANHWPEYFGALNSLLAPGGRVGLQAITMPHDRMIASMNTYTWILKYIFPGGQIASVKAVREQARTAGLTVTDNFAFGMHYAETLRRWRATVEARADAVEDLGFDLVFRRMWSLYLGYSEAGFRSGYLDVNQFTLTKAGATS